MKEPDKGLTETLSTFEGVKQQRPNLERLCESVCNATQEKELLFWVKEVERNVGSCEVVRELQSEMISDRTGKEAMIRPMKCKVKQHKKRDGEKRVKRQVRCM